MKKPILLLQFRPEPTAGHEIECIKRAMRLKNNEINAVNVTEGEKLPTLSDISKYSAVILGASSDYDITTISGKVKSRCLKVETLIYFLIKNDIPTLGICFGHQLLAKLAGGKVERDNKQAEGGVVKVYLNKSSTRTKLFSNFPKSFYIASGHKDSVTRLPKGAKRLAFSKATKYSVFQIKNNIFGIQQHPELDANGLLYRLSLFPEYLRGRSLREAREELKPMPHAPKLLLNFKKLLS